MNIDLLKEEKISLEAQLKEINDQIRTEEFNQKAYMFSEKAGLMCSVNGEMCSVNMEGMYWVENGGWEGKRDGDQFTVIETGRVLTVTDWKEIRLGDLTEEERANWHLPIKPSLSDSSLYEPEDQDICF